MRPWLALAPFAGLAFILPFPGTVAFRLLCLAAAFLIGVMAWRRLATPPLPARSVLLVWALVPGAAVLYSFDPSYSAGEWKNEVGYAFMAFVAFFAFVRSPREERALLFALGAAAVLITVWGAVNVLRLGVWPDEAGHGGAGTLSAYFAAVAPLFGVAAVAAPERRMRWASVAVLAAMLVGALLIRQRMLFLIFVVQLVAGLALAHRSGLLRLSRRVTTALLTGAVVAAVAAVAVSQAWRMQTRQTTPLERDVRWSSWPKIVERIADEPVAGAGFGRQAMRKAHADLLPAEDIRFWHAHNAFLNAGLAMGLPGMLALAWVFLGFGWIHFRLTGGSAEEARWLGIAGILVILGVLGRNLTNDFFVRDGSLLFWAINGALLGRALRLDRPA